MASIKLDVVSPDNIVYSGDIAMLIVRSTGGELGILPHHAPLVTGLVPHAMRVKYADHEDLIAVAGGFMEVQPEKITVLASAAEQPEHIDVNRAQRAYERARERIAKFHQTASSGGEQIDIVRAEAALHRAMARLQATNTSVNY